jgi:hypothetical protein
VSGLGGTPGTRSGGSVNTLWVLKARIVKESWAQGL